MPSHGLAPRRLRVTHVQAKLLHQVRLRRGVARLGPPLIDGVVCVVPTEDEEFAPRPDPVGKPDVDLRIEGLHGVVGEQ